MKAFQFFPLLLAAGVVGVPQLSHAAAPSKLSAAEADFFESKIRPVLVENCYKCHSAGAEKLKGGLLLDTRDGVLKGGDTGPAVVPGNTEKSLLITAVRYKDKDLQMPPGDKKLPDTLIADLEQWVRMGAPDPRIEGTTAKAMYAVDMETAKKHWAYKPVVKPAVPAAGDAAQWAQNDLDRFILAAMQPKGLSPSKRADKVTLIRRATFDLHGLPPGIREVDDFVNDSSANAWAVVIDRLLASPRYGERWGRHWLDLAKYADTKGPANQGRDNRYLWSYTYRDWVIRAFNEDMPYDQFLLRQIAGDKLSGSSGRDLAAMGFLTLGNRLGNNINDIIDDRIDLIGKSTMGLTLACARCHDHKFDPIPTKDYYSLHGVFNSSNEPREGPTLEPIKDTPLYRDYLKQLTERELALSNFVGKVEKELAADMRSKIDDYLLGLHEFKKLTNGLPRGAFFQRKGLLPQLGNSWDNYLRGKAAKHNPVWAPWFAFEALDDREFAAKARAMSASFYANTNKARPINPIVARLFVSPPATLSQVAARYGALLTSTAKQWDALIAGYDARKRSSMDAGPEPAGFPDKDLEEIRHAAAGKNSPIFIDDRITQAFIQRDNKTRDSFNTLQKTVNDVKSTHPGSPARAHVLEDNEKPRDSFVMIKGNAGSRGPVVPRQAPEIIKPNRAPFHDGSGRLELAQTIASKENPLTARVMVNRAWLHHFGAGLVATPDDFGVRSEPPTHPQLLDYLAARFMENGWSIKSLHRLMMLSATYQQSSEENARYNQTDPDNRYYWQFNRQRLDFEAMRDALLAIGGKLDTTMGGPGVPLDREPYPERRTIYGYVDRTRVPNMSLAFDFANPDMTTGRRNQTIVPQQALFMMNSPLVVEQAKNLTLRPDFKTAPGAHEKIKLLYRLIYQRAPSDIEMKLALDYLQGEGTVTTANTGTLAWEYGYGEFDPASKQMKTFVQMGNFNGNAWVPGTRGNKAGPVALTAKGGRPGNGPAFGAVRRWTARRDGFVSIDGVLGTQSKELSDNARGIILSSGTGLLGTFSGPHGSLVPTKLPRVAVKRGDTIDFLVIGKGPFTWTPIVKLEGGKPGEVAEWNAEKDFSGTVSPKHLEPWEKLAQVLLETNELTFIN
ncbi:MAG: hypothetical protein QOF48_3883 [Verrucomicrobiota bacterium]